LIQYRVIIQYLAQSHQQVVVEAVQTLMLVHLLARAVLVVEQDLAAIQLQVKALNIRVTQVVMEITQATHFRAVEVVEQVPLAAMLQQV